GLDFQPEKVERAARAALVATSEAAVREGRLWSVSAQASRAFWTTIYTATLEGLGAADDVAAPGWLYEQFTQSHRYAPFPDALPALRELKAHGYRLGLVSNWEGWLPSVLDRTGLMPLLDAVAVSGLEGVEKPDPALFRIALERMGVEPARAVYVGDSPSHDVQPALALGMGAVLIDRHGRHDGVHRPTIASLGLLAAVL
ncbi:MAG: HAD family hydrolase, partial [Actinomycetota bacterium]